MINRLSGTLIASNPPQAVIDVGGVAYELDLPLSHFAQLPSLGSLVVCHTHLVIREDAHLLYGFLEQRERDCFRQLIKVSGIGPKIALALLSTLNSSELQLAIEQADLSRLCQTPGIGKKVAERMVLELKGKLTINLNFAPSDGLFAPANDSQAVIRDDISNALSSLGYASREISQVLKQLPNPLPELSHAIKQALQLLHKG